MPESGTGRPSEPARPRAIIARRIGAASALLGLSALALAIGFHALYASTLAIFAAPLVIYVVIVAIRVLRAEEALLRARLEGERAVAGKTRFLANVSHELRTPLNAIIGFSEMLANQTLSPPEPAKQREYAKIIGDSGRHLLDVVNSILDMSKIEAGSMRLVPEPFAPAALIDQCCDMMRLQALEAGVTLTREDEGAIEEIVADKRAFRQILLNLLSNAIKFTQPGGRVRVRLREEGDQLALTVSDNGVGVAACDLARLGDPFFQASAAHDRAYEGAGLGLSVVRGLVGLHGGSITIESAPGKGACVTVRLPADCSKNAVAAHAMARIETIARHDAAPIANIGAGSGARNQKEMAVKIA
ncbi:HAMP domain-containing sensor histidine kinase [Methylocystis sp. 9N]|uniref:histidine kinase n=1 Tax=Methylocystis borbori TaxID=3118750 RepID=A0ABU7XKV5_9HYPH